MKYLFTLIDDKDKEHKQTKEDVSKTNKKKSAYYDIKDKKLKQFYLEGEGHKYLVDLVDGHFEIDGVKFKMHEGNLSDFRLVYYREHRINYTGMLEVDHLITYCLGWQTTSGGKNYKKIMQIQ